MRSASPGLPAHICAQRDEELEHVGERGRMISTLHGDAARGECHAFKKWMCRDVNSRVVPALDPHCSGQRALACIPPLDSCFMHTHYPPHLSSRTACACGCSIGGRVLRPPASRVRLHLPLVSFRLLPPSPSVPLSSMLWGVGLVCVRLVDANLRKCNRVRQLRWCSTVAADAHRANGMSRNVEAVLTGGGAFVVRPYEDVDVPESFEEGGGGVGVSGVGSLAN
ncbi:hypothetical protein B0H16DRAFT_1572650 [Mycena metata]|uniref:Uncharacterized protein n=1 Tax=Mycena metata TaxID=1033252 RepID=A0AAD7I823_9AGAR|nr:hypothetical protein B0H16DRAFT_1572650 [Mycena metata]